uniref:Uncharacterized protein n=1 Tax=Anguilla anguilla TaxID=7936 RepID=A0A0E9PXD0_ANGAN
MFCHLDNFLGASQNTENSTVLPRGPLVPCIAYLLFVVFV